MILNLTQIIVISLVIIGFSITVYLVVKNLKTQCSGTDVYHPENKRCQPECDKNSDKPIYDPDTNTCMECKPGETKSNDGICGLCTSSQSHCGDKCYNINTEKCIDNKICSKSEELCGNECYNKDTHSCICLGKDGEECSDGDTKIVCKIYESACDDKCYDTGKQTCDSESHTLCDKDKSYSDGTRCCPKHQRPYEDRKCVDCAEELCGGTCCNGKECCNGNCCDNSKGEFCKEGICCKKDEINVNGICCKKGEINVDGICCKKGEINCNGKCCDGSCCGDTCCKQECCGGICCDEKDGVNYSCVKDKCCPTNKVVNDKNGNVMCCDGDDKVISKDGKSCVIGCGDEECDLDNQFCASVVDKDGNTQYSCANKEGCSRSAIEYDPILTTNNKSIPIVDKDGNPIPVCKVSIGGVDKYYTVKNTPGVTGALNRDSYYKLEDKECNKGDCLNTIKEEGNIFSQYNESTKKCYTEYDCNKLLPDYKDARDDEKCPITKDGKFSDRCCVDKDGKVTGQVCPRGQFCENGDCIAGYGFDKSQNSKDCSKIYNREWFTNGNKFYNTIKECRKEEAKNMSLNCGTDCNSNCSSKSLKSCKKNDKPCKYPTWDKEITGKDELTCWNEKIPTICYERGDWTSKNGHFPKEWSRSREISSWWNYIDKNKGVKYKQGTCGGGTHCNKEPNSKYAGASKSCVFYPDGDPYCVTKNRIDRYFNWKC